MSGGGGGGGGLRKICVTLTIIFVISLAALLAEIFYLLWRRRGDQLSQNSGSDPPFAAVTSSKELLCFFCVKSNSQLGRNSINANSTSNGTNSDQQSESEVIDFDLMKIQSMFGPPKFLFTIKEEEIEELDPPAEKESKNMIKRRSFEDFLNAAEEEAVVVEIDETTPFSTPCATPLYFTPSASPVDEVVNVWSTEDGKINSELISGSVCGGRTVISDPKM